MPRPLLAALLRQPAAVAAVAAAPLPPLPPPPRLPHLALGHLLPPRRRPLPLFLLPPPPCLVSAALPASSPPPATRSYSFLPLPTRRRALHVFHVAFLLLWPLLPLVLPAAVAAAAVGPPPLFPLLLLPPLPPLLSSHHQFFSRRLARLLLFPSHLPSPPLPLLLLFRLAPFLLAGGVAPAGSSSLPALTFFRCSAPCVPTSGGGPAPCCVDAVRNGKVDVYFGFRGCVDPPT